MQPLVNWSLYDKLKAGGPAVGAWVASTDPTAAEIVAGHAWDFVLIESEHVCFNPESIRGALMGISVFDRPAIVRVPWRSEYHIKYALDTGAAGVLVPRIETPEQAAKAISFTRYPPKGRRGFAPQRVSNYGRATNEYAEKADRVLCLFMLETASALERIDEICGLDGIGGLLIGPADLAVDLGLIEHVGERHPKLQEAMDHVYARAAEAGVPYGAVCGSPAQGLDELRKGAKMVVVGSDIAWMRAGAATAFDQVQEGLKGL